MWPRAGWMASHCGRALGGPNSPRAKTIPSLLKRQMCPCFNREGSQASKGLEGSEFL